MNSKIYICCGFLMLIIHFHSSGANPMYDLSPSQELDNLKTVLERLQEKFALIEALDSNAELQELGVQGSIQSEPSDDSDNLQSESRMVPNNPMSFKDSLLKSLRGLQNPKMMRESSCFGRRIDRIGSLSGLGCNGARKN
ncbi:natriuretic peptides A-like [Rhinatrema bivittatum]|uniref:natriuretic peptides A-like n=1 Tax=Rhinatrema bivittatum TaxID=194408 RepID=UPI0011275967|nr:natriuretic peptides A-like [Rhinatrema bivittatum]